MNRNSGYWSSLFLGIMSIMMVSCAEKTDAAVESPPREYQIADVMISVTQQPGNPAFNQRKISISGDGTCIQTHTMPATTKQCETLSADVVLELINDFYRIRFFDLGDNFKVKRRVFMLDGSTVKQSVLRILDKESARLCFKVSNYEKCITLIQDVPKELEVLVHKILAYAD